MKQLPHALVVIDRLAEAVERETRDLSGPGPVDYRAHSQRKSQGLLELSRLEPTLAACAAIRACAPRSPTCSPSSTPTSACCTPSCRRRARSPKSSRARSARGSRTAPTPNRSGARTGDDQDAARRGLVQPRAGRRQLRRVLRDEDAGDQGGGSQGRRSGVRDAQEPRTQRADHPRRRGQGLCRRAAQLCRRSRGRQEAAGAAGAFRRRRDVPIYLRRRQDRLQPSRQASTSAR